LLGTLSEMMEHHCEDQELTDEVLELMLDCNEQHGLYTYLGVVPEGDKGEEKDED